MERGQLAPFGHCPISKTCFPLSPAHQQQRRTVVGSARQETASPSGRILPPRKGRRGGGRPHHEGSCRQNWWSTRRKEKPAPEQPTASLNFPQESAPEPLYAWTVRQGGAFHSPTWGCCQDPAECRTTALPWHATDRSRPKGLRLAQHFSNWGSRPVWWVSQRLQ